MFLVAWSNSLNRLKCFFLTFLLPLTANQHSVCSQGIHLISIMVYLFGYWWEVNEKMSNCLFVTKQCLLWWWWCGGGGGGGGWRDYETERGLQQTTSCCLDLGPAPAVWLRMSDETYLEDFDDTSIFENKAGLAEVSKLYRERWWRHACQDMRFLASIPELCDITFLVGETREPVCAVKAVLAARSRREKWVIMRIAASKCHMEGLELLCVVCWKT